MPGWCCSVRDRYFFRDLIGHSSSPSISPSMKSSKDGIMNSLKFGMMNLGVLDLSHRVGNIREGAGLPNLLADATASKIKVFQVRCLSKGNLRGS